MHQQHRPLNQIHPELLSIAFVAAHLLAYVSGSANVSSKQQSTMLTSVQEIQGAEAYMQGTQRHMSIINVISLVIQHYIPYIISINIHHKVNFHSPFCILHPAANHSMQRSVAPT
jgi:hypothetical protein